MLVLNTQILTKIKRHNFLKIKNFVTQTCVFISAQNKKISICASNWNLKN